LFKIITFEPEMPESRSKAQKMKTSAKRFGLAVGP